MDSIISRRHLAAAAGGFLAATGTYRSVSAQSADRTSTLPVINASDYSPVGDGVADDTGPLQAALDEAERQGGARVLVGPGTYRCNLVIGSNTTLQGASTRGTTLMAVAGSNRDVLLGRDFADLTGTLTQYPELRGANYIGLSSLTIDGDRSTNSAGCGIRIWGRSQAFRDLIIQNCAEDGVYLEFTTHDVGDSVEDNVEAFFHNIKTILNGGNGWRHRGPHDSILSNFVTFSNDGWGFMSEGVPDGYNGVISGTAWNSWLNGLGSFHFGAQPAFLSDSTASGPNRGIGIELSADSGAVRMTGILILGHETGLVLRGGNHIFNGVILNSISSTPGWRGTGILIDGAGLCMLDLTGSSNERAIVVQSEWGPNMIRGRLNVPEGGQLLVGDVMPTTSLDLARIGADGNEVIVQIPGVRRYQPTPVIPDGEGTPTPPDTTGSVDTHHTAGTPEADAQATPIGTPVPDRQPATPGSVDPLPSDPADETPSPSGN